MLQRFTISHVSLIMIKLFRGWELVNNAPRSPLYYAQHAQLLLKKCTPLFCFNSSKNQGAVYCSTFVCIVSRRVAMIWERGGFFERVRKVQTTLTRIFIALESESHGLSESSRKFLGNSNVFSDQTQVVSKKKKSLPILRPIFRPTSEIKTLFLTDSRHVLHNFGSQFPLGGEAVFNFSPKIALKSTKNVRFCILHKPIGGARAPPWLRYWSKACVASVAFVCRKLLLHRFSNSKH